MTISCGSSLRSVRQETVDFIIVRLLLEPKPITHNLRGISVHDSVETIRGRIAENFKLCPDTIELSFRGITLELEKTLQSYGILFGMSILVEQKLESTALKVTKEEIEAAALKVEGDLSKNPQLLNFYATLIALKDKQEKLDRERYSYTDKDLEKLALAMNSANLYPQFRKTLQKLKSPIVLKKIMQVTPGLSDQYETLAYIQNPVLFMGVANPTRLRNLADRCPVIVEAFTNIVAGFHEKMIAQPNDYVADRELESSETRQNEEQMDVDAQGPQVRDRANSYSIPVNPVNGFVTQAQLAQALAEVSASTNPVHAGEMVNTESASVVQQNEGISTHTADSGDVVPETSVIETPILMDTIPSTPGSTDSSLDPTSPVLNPIVTTDMVNDALRDALGSLSPSTEEQLQQLRSMGIADDDFSRNALEAANGSVPEALELIFGEESDPSNRN